MTLKEIKAKLKEAGVDDGVITAVTALDNSAEVSRLESELKAEQGKAKGILEDKKRYKDERDALKVSLDKIETEKLPDEEKHAKALKELQEKLEKAEQEREADAKKFAETQREARISDLTGSVKWAASTPQSTAKLIIKTALAELDDLSDESKVESILTSVKESHKSFIAADAPSGSGGHSGGDGGEGGSDDKEPSIAENQKALWGDK